MLTMHDYARMYILIGGFSNIHFDRCERVRLVRAERVLLINVIACTYSWNVPRFHAVTSIPNPVKLFSSPRHV